MEVNLVLSTVYMSHYVADFEQYCALQEEGDSMGEKRVHVNSGDFLAGKLRTVIQRHRRCFSGCLSCRLLDAGICAVNYF